VRRAELEQRHGALSPERSIADVDSARFPDDPDRALLPLWHEVLKFGAERLPSDRRVQASTKYNVQWSNRPAHSFLAYWKLGKSPGEHIIRINTLLRTSEDRVSDNLIKLLLWHELVHSITISHGHDETFTALEELWPGFLDLNAELDDLGFREART
jgi:hypothetical protein